MPQADIDTYPINDDATPADNQLTNSDQQTASSNVSDLEKIIQDQLKIITAGDIKTQWQCRTLVNRRTNRPSDYDENNNDIGDQIADADNKTTDESEFDVEIKGVIDTEKAITEGDELTESKATNPSSPDPENQKSHLKPSSIRQSTVNENDDGEDEDVDEKENKDGDDFETNLEEEPTINLDEELASEELMNLNSNLEPDDYQNYFNQDLSEDDFDDFSPEFLDEIQSTIEEKELTEEAAEEDTNKITLWRKARMIASSFLLYAEWPVRNLDFLTGVFCSRGYSATRRVLTELVDDGITFEELQLAYSVRELWKASERYCDPS